MKDTDRIDRDEVRRAIQRIGASDKKIMRWIVRRFVRDTVEDLSGGDLLNLRYEAAYIGLFWMTPALLRARVLRNTPRLLWLPQAKEEIVLPSAESLSGIEDWIKGCINAVLDHDTWVLPAGNVDLVLQPNPEGRQSDVPFFLIPMGSSYEVCLQWTMMMLVSSFSNRIRRCSETDHPNCEGIFIADRKDQAYCSTRCQGRASARRFRKAHQA